MVQNLLLDGCRQTTTIRLSCLNRCRPIHRKKILRLAKRDGWVKPNYLNPQRER